MGKEPAKKTEEKKADDKKAEEKKPAAASAEKKGAAAAPKSPRGASTEKAAPAKSPRGDKPAADKKKAADDKKKAGADKKKKDDESATPESSPEPSEDDDDAPARPSAAAAAPKTSARKAPVGAADPSKSVPDGSQVSMAVVPYGASADDELAARQEEIMLLLLEARLVLDKIVQVRYEREREELERRRLAELQDKKRAGKLSITEIQDILKNMPDEDDFDWVTEVQKIKKDLAVEIRRNHVLDRKVQKLDKRIGLIIRNRTAMDAYLNEKKEKKRKKGLEAMEPQFDLNKEPRKLELYQELFYLLQTEPRYLAKCVYLVQPEEMDTFLATTILTLYGDAFSPREEFLILRLFKLSIQNEVAKIKSLGDFLNANTVVPKMVITYNRRKLGAQYLRTTLNPVLKQVIEKSDLTLELHPTIIYQAMINEMEVRTGQKSNLERNISEDEAVKNPEVKAIMKKRLDVLTEICQSFLDAIINSMSNLPYGIRWICKTIGDIARARFGEAVDQDQILKVTGYFVYYRFINLAIVTPDAYKVVDRDLSAVVRKNLVVVGKVLQNLFNFRAFGDQSPEKYLRPLNAWIEKNKPTVEHYFASLVTVDEPEDYLQVTKYNELTQRTKPVIMISTQEITNTHKLLIDNLEQLAPEKDDELRTILTDLGECPPQIDAESVQNREIQLTLTARFKVDVDDDDETERLYAETKEMIIPILRTIPIETTIHRLHLTDVLESGIRYATEKKNTDLSERIEKVLESIAKLEKAGKVSKADRYQQLVSDIGKEVANRNAVREQQKREIQRLRGTLEEMRTHQKYANEQLEQYKEYLKNAREMHQQQAQGKKKKKDKGGKEVKAKYKDLEKAGVIRDSEVPKLLRGKTTFIISTEDFSSYEVTAKLAGQEASLTIELDELLELHYNSTEVYEVSQPQQISLDVNMLIFYINRNFLASKKK